MRRNLPLLQEQSIPCVVVFVLQLILSLDLDRAKPCRDIRPIFTLLCGLRSNFTLLCGMHRQFLCCSVEYAATFLYSVKYATTLLYSVQYAEPYSYLWNTQQFVRCSLDYTATLLLSVEYTAIFTLLFGLRSNFTLLSGICSQQVLQWDIQCVGSWEHGAVMSEYHKMDTNEHRNIFGCHIMYRRISKYIRMPHYVPTNIQIYSDATYLPNKYPNIFVRRK